MKVGERLKHLRVKKKLKQDDIAKLLGITRAAYSKVETGKIELTLKHIRKLTDYFKVSADWLINGSKPGSPGPGFDGFSFGEFEDSIKRMLGDMNNSPVFLHGILSHYHEMLEKRSIAELGIES